LRSLPSYASVFFGREGEKRLVLEALAQYRLITLAGLGGFGKTRLAVESAREATSFNTVAFVSLSECADADLIADCVRSALRMEASREDVLAQLCAFLSEQDWSGGSSELRRAQWRLRAPVFLPMPKAPTKSGLFGWRRCRALRNIAISVPTRGSRDESRITG
jgi:hypothetical protein